MPPNAIEPATAAANAAAKPARAVNGGRRTPSPSPIPAPSPPGKPGTSSPLVAAGARISGAATNVSNAALQLIKRPVTPVVAAASNVAAATAAAASTVASRAGALNAHTCAFCGGKTCRYCGSTAAATWPGHTVLPHLYSSWVTPNVLAMARPAAFHMEQHALAKCMLAEGIKCILNLQQPHEHPACGYGVLPATGFSYDPEEWIRQGFFYYNFSWEDMNVPTFEQILSIVKVMANEIASGRRVAVHCHAGLGRTGLAIACYLVYDQNMSAFDAVQLVRTKRPGSVQTAKQAGFVSDFATVVARLRSRVSIDPRFHGQFDILEVMKAQRALLHGVEARLSVHKLVLATLNQIRRLTASLSVDAVTASLRSVVEGTGTEDAVREREEILAEFAATFKCTAALQCTDVTALFGVLSVWCLSFLKSPPIPSIPLPDGFLSERIYGPARALTVEVLTSVHLSLLDPTEPESTPLLQLVIKLLSRELVEDPSDLATLRDQLRALSQLGAARSSSPPASPRLESPLILSPVVAVGETPP
ncbi:hypothetical protein H9P43_001855 [Blastocladiella emersonii ATCC 22665]|nr:hypothetical protein H9P43_001855 [Blastocladiella emersonii ATCC 22665]